MTEQDMQKELQVSPLARHVLGSMFGWNQVLTFHNVENVPSPEMRAVLYELVASGALVREVGLPDMPSHGQAERFRLAQGFDVASFRNEAAKAAFGDKVPSVRLFVRKV